MVNNAESSSISLGLDDSSECSLKILFGIRFGSFLDYGCMFLWSQSFVLAQKLAHAFSFRSADLIFMPSSFCVGIIRVAKNGGNGRI